MCIMAGTQGLIPQANNNFGRGFGRAPAACTLEPQRRALTWEAPTVCVRNVVSCVVSLCLIVSVLVQRIISRKMRWCVTLAPLVASPWCGAVSYRCAHRVGAGSLRHLVVRRGGASVHAPDRCVIVGARACPSGCWWIACLVACFIRIAALVQSCVVGDVLSAVRVTCSRRALRFAAIVQCCVGVVMGACLRSVLVEG
jgi:hypothetical protein